MNLIEQIKRGFSEHDANAIQIEARAIIAAIPRERLSRIDRRFVGGITRALEPGNALRVGRHHLAELKKIALQGREFDRRNREGRIS